MRDSRRRAPRYNLAFMQIPPSHTPVETRFEHRLLVVVGLSLWLLSAVACVWEVLVLQPPDSPLHVGVLASPVAQLRSYTFGLGTGCMVLALLWPLLYPPLFPNAGRWVAFTLSAGALLHALTLTYAAQRGLLAVQLFDPRADARYTLYLRALAHALTIASTIALLLRALSSARQRS